jgi:DNA repair protein RadC
VCGEFFDSHEKVAYLISLKLSMYDREVFACLFLNAKNQLISFDKMFFGSTNQARIFVSEIAKKALLLNSVGVIISHNHPSGNLEPSNADRKITTKIRKALKLFEIDLIDHVLVNKNGESYSFKADGLMDDYDNEGLNGYW